MEANALQALVDKVTFRKTTYIEPHEYIVRAWSADCAALHEAVSQQIAQAGYARRFLNRTYRYINLNGYRYWTLGDVLNRAALEEKEEAENARQG